MIELRKPDPVLKRILPEQKLQSGALYTRSLYALPCEYEGRNLCFHTLTRELIELTPSLPCRISSDAIRENEELSSLMRGYFLVPEGKNETASYRDLFQVIHSLAKKNAARGFTILPTTACNARCIYCFEKNRKPETMTPELTEYVAEYINKKRTTQKTAIKWFGGEPLTAAGVIDTICFRLKEKGIPFVSDIVTNGSLITEEIADTMTGLWNMEHAQVSMDGDKRDYMARKRYVRPADQYQTVLNGIRFMAERGIRVSVRCNVDRNNIDTIEAFLSDLSEALPDKQNVDVSLTALNQERMGEQGQVIWRKISESRTLIRSFGFQVRDPRFLFSDIRTHHCKADLGSIVIGPDGGLYACEECTQESCFGNIADDPENTGAAKQFCRVDRIREKCRRCPFLPECTPFASCPVQEKQCVEIQRLRFLEKVKGFFREKPQ